MNPFDPFRKDLLASKTTLITGGATGLGRAMAERMAGLGAKIAVIGRRPEPLAETAKAIRDAGGEAVGISADVRDPEAVARAVEEAEKSLGPINQLITTPQATSSPRPRICRPTPSTRWCRSSSTEPSMRPRGRQAAHRAGREGRGALDRHQLRDDGLRLRAALGGRQVRRARHDAVAPLSNQARRA